MDLAGIARNAIREAAPAIEAPPATPDAYRPLLGMYLSVNGGELIRLEWRDGELIFIMPNDPVWRAHTLGHRRSRRLHGRPRIPPSGEPARFTETAEGRVRALFLGGETWSRLDPIEDGR